MSGTRQLIPITGLLLTFAVSSHMVARLSGQQTPGGDFTNATTAEVRGPNGVLLRGQFAAAVEDDDDELERKATLAATGAGSSAAGEAEVEFDKGTLGKQEVEFSVTGLPAGTRLTFVIDGREVATATTDQRGRAEAEVDINASGVAASR